MATITLHHLSFGYDGQAPLFTDVNLNLDAAWHLALVGRNGRGKTTLLRLLQHQLPFTGTISAPATHYFPQPIPDPDQLTLYAMQAVSPAEQWELERELNLLHVDPDVLWRPYATLSGGEQTKVRLALLFVDADQFALIDEPTNHLDAASREQVAAYLQKKTGFIVVSHDRHFLDAVSDHTLAINKQTISLTQGNYSTYAAAKAQQDAFEQAENARLKTDIARLQATAREKQRWSTAREGDKHGNRHVPGSGAVADKGFVGARAARVMQKAKNLEHRMDAQLATKQTLLKDIEDIPSLTINTTPDHHRVYWHVTDLQLAYDRPLFAPVSFDLEAGERIALVGPNGSGKSSLLAALFGEFSGSQTGEIHRPASVTWSRVRQAYADNQGSLQAFAAARHLPYQDLLNNLKKLGLERASFTTPITAMSQGQQKKVEVAASLVTPANVLVWDEPTNYLDIDNQTQLIQAIQANQPTMLFVEHDQAFIDQVATKIIRLRPA